MAKKTPAKRKKPVPREEAPAGKKARSAPHLPFPTAESSPHIVGVGASAGGLEAFTQLLRALPIDTGMAFVLVQHLEPKHESVLTALLARDTKMPVQEVREGMHVQPNNVYVIPANADLSLLDGLLHIVGRKAPAGRHLPIDYFFRSLADTRGPGAIGVILSGTASDGTAGVKAIKEAGGITFAQDPESARFDGMPRNAIASGCVDFVLPPERIARELARIVRHPFVGLLPIADVPALSGLDEEWTRLFRLLRTGTGVDFTQYKKSTLRRRLARRMAVTKADRLGDYLKVLERNRGEMDALFEELLILVTSFFRDPEVFLALQRKVFPKLLADKPAGELVRIWVAGCSTGQEAYSIAICVLEALGEKAASTQIQIFATDVSEDAIEKARLGIYPEADVKEISKERLRRYFTRVNGNYQVNQAIREMCVFARHDLTRDPPFSRLDLISCRNVLIYMEPSLQKRVLAAFHYGLKPNGGLLLGKSESLGAHPDLFTVIDRKFKFFRKTEGAHVPFNMVQPAYEHVSPGKPLKEPATGIDLEKEADQVVWERYAHAGLVVNNDLQILHFRGDTSPYLRPVPGKASLQVMRILREEIVLEVRSALQKARRSEQPVRRENIEFHHNGHVRKVNVEVRPLIRSGSERCFLILFERGSGAADDPGTARSRRGKERKGDARRRDQEVLRLREELARTREYVQAIIRDQETTNEELKTANEEALSSMEELQSTNEELETAKEELQSSNEELVTLNEQLQNRNTELGQLSNDMSNVLSSVDIPIVILDADRRIRRFTTPAESLLGLIPGDLGRFISKLRIGIHIPDLEQVISTVVVKGTEISREVQAETGRWFLLRVRPFRTGEESIEGVVLAFVDIQELREHQEALQKDKNFISAILDAARDLLVVVLDSEGRIVHFNVLCQKLTGYSIEEVRGRYVWDFLLDPGEVESVKATFREVAAGTPNQRENYWIAKDGHRVLISWSNSVAKSDGEVESVIATGFNVTERQEAHRRAQQSEDTVRALLESAAQAILACDRNGKIVLANVTAEKMFGYSRDVLLGRAVESLLPQRFRERHAAHRAAWFAQPHNRPMGAGLELAGQRANGSEFPVEVSLSSVATPEGTLGVAFVSDISERRSHEKTLFEYKEQLQKLTGALLTAQESGNRDLARELHDVYSQELAALSMEISSLLQSPGNASSVKQRLAAMGTKIGQLADGIHRASRRLHPAILDELGLEAALREECQNWSAQTGIPVKFSAERVARSIAGEVPLCLYRVAQEALRNIAKHAAGTSEVSVRVAGVRGGTQLLVADRGDGFDLMKARKKGGLGLVSMEERVRLVNGDLDIRSQPGQGTTVEVFVPAGRKET